MTNRARSFSLGVTLIAIGLSAPAAFAQGIGEHLTVEAVGSASTTAEAPNDPMLVFDGVATIRTVKGLDFVVRPYAHRLPGGDWTAEMYQLQLRYVPPTPVHLRVDAGILAAPIGQATLEVIPDRNPTIGAPFFFFAPLPSFSPVPQKLVVLSPGYPLGLMVSASGDRWDARAGVVDQTPARRRNVLASNAPPAAAQVVAGGGVTVVTGLRVGAGLAQGQYDTGRGLDATVANVEAEYSVAYTRVAAEWIRDRFETVGAPAIVHAWTVESVQTLTPRWFAALRVSRADTPVLAQGALVRRAAAATEETVGFRLNPELTLRVGHQASHWYGVPQWDHALAASFVVSRRWW